MTTYRYELFRDWLGSGGVVNFIMLNPSTADDTRDDPTIRKCAGFAKRWGFNGIVVTNLFALRATDPADLKRMPPALAIGSDNDEMIRYHAVRSQAIVCAWGDHGTWQGRDAQVRKWLDDYDLGCIGLTQNRNPLHPGRCSYTSAPAVYQIRQLAAGR